MTESFYVSGSVDQLIDLPNNEIIKHQRIGHKQHIVTSSDLSTLVDNTLFTYKIPHQVAALPFDRLVDLMETYELFYKIPGCKISCGDYTIHTANNQAFLGEVRLELSSLQSQLLSRLFQGKGENVLKSDLLEDSKPGEINHSALKMQISRLRTSINGITIRSKMQSYAVISDQPFEEILLEKPPIGHIEVGNLKYDPLTGQIDQNGQAIKFNSIHRKIMELLMIAGGYCVTMRTFQNSVTDANVSKSYVPKTVSRINTMLGSKEVTSFKDIGYHIGNPADYRISPL